MSELIVELRGMANAGAGDYTVNGVSYWTDDQLEKILDRYRTEVVEELLYHASENAGIRRYYSQFGNFEQTSGGTAVFVVMDGLYDAVGTALYSIDYTRGEVVFSADTGGAGYYLTARSYDLNQAAADVWTQKAGQVAAASYSWSTDNMRVDKGKVRTEYMDQARHYRALAGPKSITMERSDT
jgi:hypothetical protein